MKNWNSSYEINSYDSFFESIVKTIKPKIIVELGTKDGYSANAMAKGLVHNKNYGISGHLFCFDLWEDYEFSSCSLNQTKKNLSLWKNLISFEKVDVFSVSDLFENVDLLHVDISNDGEKLSKLIPQWINKTKYIVIEGGSTERDNVGWMKKYKKSSIKDFLKSLKDVQYFTLDPFPSLTLIKKN